MNRRCYVCHDNTHLSANCGENVLTRCFMCFREARTRYNHEASCTEKNFVSSDITDDMRVNTTKLIMGFTKQPMFEVNSKVYTLQPEQGLFVSPDEKVTLQRRTENVYVVEIPKYYHIRSLVKTNSNYLVRFTHTMQTPYLEKINKAISQMDHEETKKLKHYALLDIIVDEEVMFYIENNGKRFNFLVSNGVVHCQNHQLPAIQN